MKLSAHLTAAVLLVVIVPSAGAQLPAKEPRATTITKPTPAPTRPAKSLRSLEDTWLHDRLADEPFHFDVAKAPVIFHEPFLTEPLLHETKLAMAPLPPMEPWFPAKPLEPMLFETVAPLKHIEPLMASAWSDGKLTTAWAPRADSKRSSSEGFTNAPPLRLWTPQDTPDSLYRAAREALNRSEYRVAARLFQEVRTKYPRYQHAGDAAYFEAFALYRIGTVEDLRNARQVLKAAQAERYSQESMQADAVSLAARIQGALARRGDPEAQQYVREQAARGLTCDREELEVRTEALSALVSTEESSAVPIIRRVLENRDNCTAPLRRNAIHLLVRRNADSSVLPLLIDVVRNDPEMDVRRSAVNAMSRVSGPQATVALQEILRTSKDESIQVSAVQAIAQRDDWSGLRGFIERNDAPLQLRVSALGGIHRERSTPDDAAWLRGLYPRMTEPRMREAIADAVGRLGGDTNEQWLLALARNADEPTRVRTTAISRLNRSQVPLAEFIRIYDAAAERPIREYVLRVIAERASKEPAALDKMIDIAKNSTDIAVRRSAVSYLTRHKADPRVQQLLLELVGGGTR